MAAHPRIAGGEAVKRLTRYGIDYWFDGGVHRTSMEPQADGQWYARDEVDAVLAEFAPQAEPVVWQYRTSGASDWSTLPHWPLLVGDGDERRPLYAAPQPQAEPVGVSRLRQPRHDLQRLVEAIKSAVYENGAGLSVTEAVGALELAKHEILQEQGQ